MATCLEIITYALRMSRIVGLGRQPKSAESDEGLIALQSMYDQWRTGGMFGTLEDVYLEGDDIAEEGKRYFVPDGYTLTDATSVYLDSDEQTRQPRDLALYESLLEDGTQAAYLYDRIEWVPLLGLTEDDVAPLSGRNAYGLAACLATSGGFIAAFGAEPSPATIALARHFLRNLMGKKGSTQDSDGAVYY
jgi:hypothetical protein